MAISSSLPHYCDFVAKGGITSGVIYPLAITRLARVFSFRNLGGTSVGAIAAAATAAAEYGRRRHNLDSFEELERLPSWLTEKRKGCATTNLFMLFQPNKLSKNIFRVCAALLGGGKSAFFRVFFTAAGVYIPAAVVGAFPGVAIMVLAFLHTHSALSFLTALAGVVTTILGMVITIAWAFTVSVIHVLPRNYYGLCIGRTEGGSNKEQPALSDWLTDYLDRLAGKLTASDSEATTPLTFGNLWWPDLTTGKYPAGYDPREYTVETVNDRKIRLEMMSTCLTEGRPYRLPFRDDFDVRENRRFWYKEEDFRKFFPDRIVDWMISNARPSKRADRLRQEGFYALPDPWNLPVVVAVRMSLSFPILMSAVPLYSAKDEDEELEICWFSDGGICSNFPIHFFDSPIPQWPTFAINLSDLVKETDAPVWMPSTISDGANGNSTQFEYSYGQGGLRQAREDHDKLFGFVKAILFTMHNWNDSTLSVLPGYRERIAHVRLSPGEGGLNLNMPTKILSDLSERGALAAEMLIERYSRLSEHDINMNTHRWVRFRTMLASLEELLIKLEWSCQDLEKEQIEIARWIETNGGDRVKYYQWRPDDQWKTALSSILALRALARELRESKKPLAIDSPRPRPEMRGRPRL